MNSKRVVIIMEKLTAKRQFFNVPSFVDLSITNKCNLQCTYCYADACPSSEVHMKYTTIEALISEFETAGVHYVRIAGGEPLLHPQIGQVLDRVGHSRLLTSISTNGTLVNRETAQYIKDSNIDWVVVSLDGHDKETNNATRGSFDNVISGIENLLSLGIVTKLACVVTKSNYSFIADIIKFSSQLNVCSVGFLLFSKVGRAIDNYNELSLDKDSIREIVRTVNEFKKSPINGLRINLVFPHESAVPWELSTSVCQSDIEKFWGIPVSDINTKKLGCNAGIVTCSINANGDVYGCEQLMNFPAMNAGNVANDKFVDIWKYGKSFKYLRSIDFEDLKGKCAKCDRIGCGGGCRAIALGVTNDFLAFGQEC